LNGVYQNKNTYSTSGTTLTFSTAPANTVSIEVIVLSQTAINTPASNSVTTSTIADGNVTTSKINDDAITLAKLAGLARGKIIYGDASGNPAALALGTNGQVLKSDGTDISWGSDSAGTITGVTNFADNRIATASGGTTLNGEANLTFNGATLAVTGAITASTTLTVGGTATFTGLVDAAIIDGANFKVNGGQGSDGQVLTSTGSGVAWEASSGTTINNNADNRIITGSGTANTLNGESGLTYDGSTLAVTGDANFDSNTLFVDASANSVGIGTASPFSPLHISKTDWSSGAPYGTVAYIEGGAVNDLNWGHLVISQTGTTTDTGGRLSFGANGQNPIAGIRAKYKGATYGDLAFLTRPSGGTNTERMVISSSGNMGIGTASPDAPLHVEATNASLILSNSGRSQYWRMQNNETDDALVFNASDANERLRISSSGNLGLGTQSPSAKLHVATAGAEGINIGLQNSERYYNMETDGGLLMFKDVSAGGVARMTFDTSGNIHINKTAVNQTTTLGFDLYANGTVLATHTVSNNESWILNNYNGSGTSRFDFRWNNSSRGGINVTSSAVAFATSSDYRLKENVDYTWDATTRLKQLKPARFNWISDDKNTLVDGFLAHEVTSVVPNAVTGTKDEMYDSEHDLAGEEKHQSIDHSKLVPLLVKTIQELEARITALES